MEHIKYTDCYLPSASTTFVLSHMDYYYYYLLLGVPALGEHSHCSLTYMYLFFVIVIIFPPLRIPKNLDYIDNVGVKMFVLVPVELLVFLFTFRCMV